MVAGESGPASAHPQPSLTDGLLHATSLTTRRDGLFVKPVQFANVMDVVVQSLFQSSIQAGLNFAV